MSKDPKTPSQFWSRWATAWIGVSGPKPEFARAFVDWTAVCETTEVLCVTGGPPAAETFAETALGTGLPVAEDGDGDVMCEPGVDEATKDGTSPF